MFVAQEPTEVEPHWQSRRIDGTRRVSQVTTECGSLEATI